MSLVPKYVCNVLVTHKRYGAGDVIGLSEADFRAYQAKPEFQKLVQLLHVDLPNGDRIPVDSQTGELLEDKPIKAEVVKRENQVRSTVKRLVREEKLTKADEDRFIRQAMTQPEAFLKDPRKYLRDAESGPKKNRMGAGPALQR